MHNVYVQLTKGELIKIGGLDDFDTLSILIAGACHDYGHDGFNNSYHVNAMTTRAINCHDISVQESYHAAESFKLMMNTRNNFLDTVSIETVKKFKKRMISAILATDMAKHSADLTNLKSRIEQKGIKKELRNGHLFVNQMDERSKFETQ